MAVKKLRVGLIGLGARGSSLLESVLLPMEDVEITAVCDVYEDRTASATALLEKAENMPRLLCKAQTSCCGCLLWTPWSSVVHGKPIFRLPLAL